MRTREIILYSILSLFIVVILLWGCPQYNVYRMKKKGEASLANANYSRQVRIAEAKAVRESAQLLAEADTLRAHGTAKSNEIIGRSITQEYLQWFWMNGLHENKNAAQYIYVPSGTLGMPIMEAQRFNIKSTNNNERPETEQRE